MTGAVTHNLDEISSLADKAAAALGLAVVDVSFKHENRKTVLKVTIYRKDGFVGLSDCEKVSRNLEELLDKAGDNIVKDAYLLEVESPGLDRVLKTEKELAAFQGQGIEVHSKENIDKLGYHFFGTLAKSDKDNIKVLNPYLIEKQSKAKQKKATKVEENIPKELTLKKDRIKEIRLYPESKVSLPTNTKN